MSILEPSTSHWIPLTQTPRRPKTLSKGHHHVTCDGDDQPAPGRCWFDLWTHLTTLPASGATTLHPGKPQVNVNWIQLVPDQQDFIFFWDVGIWQSCGCGRLNAIDGCLLTLHVVFPAGDNVGRMEANHSQALQTVRVDMLVPAALLPNFEKSLVLGGFDGIFHGIWMVLHIRPNYQLSWIISIIHAQYQHNDIGRPQISLSQLHPALPDTATNGQCCSGTRMNWGQSVAYQNDSE